jgi:hypothetical protein
MLVALNLGLQPKRIIAHDPTGNRRVKELFLFVHPYIEHEYRHSDEAPDLLKAFLYCALLYRNFCIVDTLNGILEAYVRVCFFFFFVG